MRRAAVNGVPTGYVPTRYATVWCPQWPVAAVLARYPAANRPGSPVAVLDARKRVVARSVAAAAAGVRVGQRRREAQARCPALEVFDAAEADAVQMGRAFEQVVGIVAEHVAEVEIGEPGSCWFDIRGPVGVYGGEQAVAELLTARITAAVGHLLAQSGPVGVGVAEGRLAAALAARVASRTGRPQRVTPGTSAAFLADHGVAALAVVGVPARDIGLLHRLGLRRLGDLAALDERDLGERFGALGVEIHRAVRGVDDRPLDAHPPPDDLTMVHEFEPPVEHRDAVAFAGRGLAERLVDALAAQGRVCTVVDIGLDTVPALGRPWSRRWSVPAGLRVADLVDRIRWQAEGGHPVGAVGDPDSRAAPPCQGIVRLRLEPVEVRPARAVHEGLWGERRDDDDRVERAIARVRALVGDGQVLTAERRGGRHPEAAVEWVPVVGYDIAAGGADRRDARHSGGDAPWPGRLPAPSPSVVYAEPWAADVLDATGRPVVVGGRGEVSGEPVLVRCDGRVDRVSDWSGPWLVDERWWDPRRHRRVARFQLLLDDGRALLAMVEHRRWWLVGAYC